MTEGELKEIGFAQELDAGNFPHYKIISMSKVDGQIDGHDVITANQGNQTVYFIISDDKKISAFLGFENNYLKNIKNFTKMPGVVRALLGYLVHIKRKNIEIAPKEPLTLDGLSWLTYLIQHPRGLKITDQKGDPIDTESLSSEWLHAKKNWSARTNWNYHK